MNKDHYEMGQAEYEEQQQLLLDLALEEEPAPRLKRWEGFPHGFKNFWQQLADGEPLTYSR